MTVQQTKLAQKDLDKIYNDLVNDIGKLFAELKKMVEQQKIAEEQERLRQLQVNDHWSHMPPLNIKAQLFWPRSLPHSYCMHRLAQEWTTGALKG